MRSAAGRLRRPASTRPRRGRRRPRAPCPAASRRTGRPGAGSGSRCRRRRSAGRPPGTWPAAGRTASGTPTCAVVSASAPARAPSARQHGPGQRELVEAGHRAVIRRAAWATGASSSRSVYSGPPAELGVRRSLTPSAAGSTTTTPVPPAARLAGTRIQRASAPYGTPILTPETPRRSVAVVAGAGRHRVRRLAHRGGEDGVAGGDAGQQGLLQLAAAPPDDRQDARAPAWPAPGPAPPAGRPRSAAPRCPAPRARPRPARRAAPGRAGPPGRAPSTAAWPGNGGSRSSTWPAAWATACWVSPRVKSTQKLEHVTPAGGQGAARDEPQLGRRW